MKLKLLYTALFILCMSAFASSNGYTRHCGGSIPSKEQAKAMLKDAGSVTTEKEEVSEFSPFLMSLFI